MNYSARQETLRSTKCIDNAPAIAQQPMSRQYTLDQESRRLPEKKTTHNKHQWEGAGEEW